MSQPEPLHYRMAPEEPAAPSEPRQDLGPLTAPLLGELDVSLGLGRPLRLAVDRHALDVEFAGGVQVRADELPQVELRKLHVDLVDGVVETDSDGLGPGFDRVLTVGLCSALRHAIGWKPGESLLERGAGRLPDLGRGLRRVWTRGAFPRIHAALDPEAALTLELRGDALELELTRPLLLRVLGLSFAALTLRYVFAEQRIEVKPGTLGPLRQVLLRFGVWLANRWLRRRLPAMMAVRGYDLFVDPRRRAHVLELVRHLREKDMSERAGAEGHVREVRPDPHPLAREPEGGAASVVSATKAALLGALATLRVSADDPPAKTRTLMTLPLGPFSSVALATDRGGDVVVAKYPGGARLDAPEGLYVYLDQFPELAELRVVRAVATLGPDGVGLDVQTEPPLGPFLRAVLRRVTREHLAPRVPVERLREGGLIAPPGVQEHHVLWRHGLGFGREVTVRTEAGATVELRHTEEALELVAPAGLSVMFSGIDWLPGASAREISYRWDDGAVEVDGDALLGEFGQSLLTAIVRARVAPLAPRGLGLRSEGGAQLDPRQLEDRPATIVDARLPLVGPLQLRMDPDDVLAVELGRAGLSASSERGLLLAAPELGKAIELRGACFSLATGELAVTSEPQPGDYLLKLAAGALRAFVLPRVRERVDLDGPADAAWTLGHLPPGEPARRLGFQLGLSLPPGAAVIARRTPHGLELGATAPLRLSPGEDSALEVAVGRVRYNPAGERIELETTPPAGPLLHSLARGLFDRLAPKTVLHALAERLALPVVGAPQAIPPAPATPPVIAPELPRVGPLTLVLDRDDIVDVVLRRGGADIDFGDGAIVRLPDAGVHVELRRARVNFLPFEVELECDPPAGELEEALVGHAARTLLARVLPLFWPGERAHGELDVLLSLGPAQPWGPVELCVPRGGRLELHLDHHGVVVRAPGGGLSFAGESLKWLPEFRLRAFSYEFGDGSVRMDVDGIAERHYREFDPISPRTEMLVAHLLRTLVLPHLPAWTQRLGIRVLPPPPPLQADPTHVTVVQAQLPGGYAKTMVTMDPADVLSLRADRTEIVMQSERGLHVDIPGLNLRVPLRGARYHMQSGEVQASAFGRLENALAEAIVRRVLTMYEPAVETSDVSALATVLDRFPRDEDGRRVLYDSKLARMLLEPDTALVVRLDETGFSVSADPGIVIDGPAVMNYRFGALRYGFDDAKFHVQLDKDGVLAPLRGFISDEGEHQLDSALRPFLPAAMRTPGYRLAKDPDPRATVAALIRTVAGGGLLLAP